jgi:hypothetical protein
MAACRGIAGRWGHRGRSVCPVAGRSSLRRRGILADLTGRGLAGPLLIISYGAPGLIAAIELAHPRHCASAVSSTEAVRN